MDTASTKTPTRNEQEAVSILSDEELTFIYHMTGQVQLSGGKAIDLAASIRGKIRCAVPKVVDGGKK